MPDPAAAVSPRIQSLWDEYARRGDAAVEEFWGEVATSGTPLIEPIPGDAEHSLVTFVWQLEDRDQQVGLVHGPLRVGELDPLDHLGSSDLAFRSYRVANDLRNAYWLVPNPPRSLSATSAEEWQELRVRREAEGEAFLRPDPLNQRRRPQRTNPLDASTEIPGHSVLELPDAPELTLVDETADVAHGALTAHRFASEYLEPDRTLWVYTPAGFDALEEPCDLLIAFDGHRAIDGLTLPGILDQLIADGRLRPTVAVFVESLFDHRHLELPCHEPFADFLADELVPWLAERYPITDDPARTTLAGASYGGLAASFGAFRHPERFGNVLAQSGSYWWSPVEREERFIAPDERDDWLTDQYASSPTLPVRFYLDAGTLEVNDEGVNLRQSVRGFRDVLLERGYELTHHEFTGGHSWACWRVAFPDALLSLVGTQLDSQAT